MKADTWFWWVVAGLSLTLGLSLTVLMILSAKKYEELTRPKMPPAVKDCGAVKQMEELVKCG